MPSSRSNRPFEEHCLDEKPGRAEEFDNELADVINHLVVLDHVGYFFAFGDERF